MPVASLADRGVVRVAGEEARTFLDGLLTCDLDRVAPGQPRYGALLSPQGKILFDFIVFAVADDAYYLDCPRTQAADLAKRLGFYRLRAKVAVEDLSNTVGVLAGWGDSPKPQVESGLTADDPRLSALGWRVVTAQDFSSPCVRGEGLAPEREASEAQPRIKSGVNSAEGEGASEDRARPDTPSHPVSFADSPLPACRERDYHAHRIGLGVPEGGKDFSSSDAFPHEALMDQLHGIDFDKGCYVGQEVVSRMQHRGTARTRIVPLVYLDGAAAEPGSDVTAGQRSLGRTGSAAGGRGLAMIRLDRAADALAAGEAIRAGGRPVRIEVPAWASFSLSSEAATPAA
jgi:folate-binding protein YgfZ